MKPNVIGRTSPARTSAASYDSTGKKRPGHLCRRCGPRVQQPARKRVHHRFPLNTHVATWGLSGIGHALTTRGTGQGVVGRNSSYQNPPGGLRTSSLDESININTLHSAGRAGHVSTISRRTI